MRVAYLLLIVSLALKWPSFVPHARAQVAQNLLRGPISGGESQQGRTWQTKKQMRLSLAAQSHDNIVDPSLDNEYEQDDLLESATMVL